MGESAVEVVISSHKQCNDDGQEYYTDGSCSE